MFTDPGSWKHTLNTCTTDPSPGFRRGVGIQMSLDPTAAMEPKTPARFIRVYSIYPAYSLFRYCDVTRRSLDGCHYDLQSFVYLR